jgi:heterokaryon incompatibility protein (HET)
MYRRWRSIWPLRWSLRRKVNRTIQLELCRSCSKDYVYNLSQDGAVTILVGIPPEGLKYKAVSHVWGQHSIVNMRCRNCSKEHHIRLRSTATFHHIMQLAGPGNSIWIDNMSIDQNNPLDISAQVAAMGDIYSKAHCVSVLLPKTDNRAYEQISGLVDIAKTLLDKRGQIQYNYDAHHIGPELTRQIKATGQLAKKFFVDFQKLQSNLNKYTYWKRAWTFQEWSLALDVEINVDSGNKKSLIYPTLRQVKSIIIYAAIMIADYKLRRGQYALMDVGFSRGFARTRLYEVKKLFPFENAFSSFNEISESELDFQAQFPNEGTDAILGLRVDPKKLRTEKEQFLSRLILMLDAFTVNKREATLEADLVCCWASMCKIPYEYSKEDSFEFALAKAIRALRGLGVTIYNFHATSRNVQDIDFEFLQYAGAHNQNNATNQAFFPDTPFLTGRSDTCVHFLRSLTAIQKDTQNCGPIAQLNARRVLGARIKMVVPLSNMHSAISALRLACSGVADNMMFWDVLQLVVPLLQHTPSPVLTSRMLVIAAIPLQANPTDLHHFNTWTVCDRSIFTAGPAPFVAREELNGTLVLAEYVNETAGAMKIISYLTVSDQQCGTYLVPCSEDGQILLTFKTPQRSDMGNSDFMCMRELRASIQFLDNPHDTEESSPGSALILQTAEDAVRLFGSWGVSVLQDNNSIIRQIGDLRTHIFENLAEIVRRREAQGQNTDGRHATPINIDLLHPELVSREQDDEDRRVFHELVTGSMRSQEIEEPNTDGRQTTPQNIDILNPDLIS